MENQEHEGPNPHAISAFSSPTTMVTKQTRDGYIYKERNSGRSKSKTPLFCPYEKCGRVTNTVDDQYILEYGVCANCYVLYIEARQSPLIDVKQYASRFKDRGF